MKDGDWVPLPESRRRCNAGPGATAPDLMCGARATWWKHGTGDPQRGDPPELRCDGHVPAPVVGSRG